MNIFEGYMTGKGKKTAFEVDFQKGGSKKAAYKFLRENNPGYDTFVIKGRKKKKRG